MANLQTLGRLGTPVLPLRPFLSHPCRLRFGPSCDPASARTKGSEHLSIRAFGAAANNESTSCSTGGGSTARYPGRIYSSSTSTERRVQRAARLLEIEAPEVNETTSRPSASTHQATFEAEVEAGHSECYGVGCRQISDNTDKKDGGAMSVVDENLPNGEASSLLQPPTATYTERWTVKDVERRPEISFPLDFAEFVNDVWRERGTATKYFEIAMKRNPKDATMLIRYAQFAWKTLGDLDKADRLFARAIEESNDDTDVHAMYALFLWQTDE